jgi:hypothetical protein
VLPVEGASALIGGPVYYQYSSSPSAVPYGCSSYGNEVDVTGITAGSVVTIAVAVQFPSAGYSSTLALLATRTSLNSTANNGAHHDTAMGVSCAPESVDIQGGAIRTATVNDTTSTPTTPTAQVDVQLPVSIQFVVDGIPLNARDTTITPISSNSVAVTVTS